MLSFLVIHARHSRRPSRSRVNFASSFATFNRPVPILSGRSWPSLPMFPLQPSTLNCQPRHSPSPLYVPISSSLSPSTATLMDPPRKCCRQKTYSKAKPFRCNTYKNTGGGVSLPEPATHLIRSLMGRSLRPGLGVSSKFPFNFQLSTVNLPLPSTGHGRTQTLSFHPLAHSFALTKTQAACFHAVAHSLPKTTRGGVWQPL